MKRSISTLITCLGLLLFGSTGYGQAIYSNTTNMITLSNVVGHCAGFLPSPNTYSFNLMYFNAATGNTSYYPSQSTTVNVVVTTNTTTKTVTINAAASSPAANFPDLTQTSAVIIMTLPGVNFTYYLDFGQITCVPLPITLSAFTASRNSNNISINVNWTTQLETNVSSFSIERAPDGGHWTSIGTKPPTNGGSVTTNYTFTDNNPYKNNNFYRLKSVDIDGKYSFSRIALVSCPSCTLLPPPPPPPPSCASLGLTGPDYLCTTTPGTFTLTNLPAGTYVNWYADASSQVNLTQGGGSTSVTKVGNGLVYILADVSGCSQGTITIHKQIQLGTALHINYSITSGPGTNYKQLIASCDFVPGTTGSSYHWTLNLGSKGTTTFTGQGISTSLPPCSGGALTVTVATPCGSSTDGVTVYNSSCGPNFAVKPNPAKSSLTITTQEAAEAGNNINAERLFNQSYASTNVSSITKIQLYDKAGRLLFEKQYATGQKLVNISLPALLPDMYIIQIYNKNEKEVKQILILQ